MMSIKIKDVHWFETMTSLIKSANFAVVRARVTKDLTIISALLAGWLSFMIAGFLFFWIVAVAFGKLAFEFQYGDLWFIGMVGAIGLLALLLALLVVKIVTTWLLKQPQGLVLSCFLVLVILTFLIRPRFFEFIIN